MYHSHSSPRHSPMTQPPHVSRVTTPNRHLRLSTTTTTPSTLRSALLSSLSYVFLSGRHGGVLSRIRLSYGSTSVLSSSYSPPSWLPCPQDPTERFRSSLITAIHLRPLAHDTATPRVPLSSHGHPTLPGSQPSFVTYRARLLADIRLP